MRPKALSLTILVDWSNQDKVDTSTAAGVKSTCHPCWLCVHFGPPPSALPHAQQHHAQMAGQWQLTLNVYSAEKTPVVKKQNEEPIPRERRALLWFATQPFDKVPTHPPSTIRLMLHHLGYVRCRSIGTESSCNTADSLRR